MSRAKQEMTEAVREAATAFSAHVDKALGRRSNDGARATAAALRAEHQAWIDDRFGPEDPRRYPADTLTGRILVGRFLDGWRSHRQDDPAGPTSYPRPMDAGLAVRLAERRLLDAMDMDADDVGDGAHVRRVVDAALWAASPEVFVPGVRSPEQVFGDAWYYAMDGTERLLAARRRGADAERRRAERTAEVARRRTWR